MYIIALIVLSQLNINIYLYDKKKNTSRMKNTFWGFRGIGNISPLGEGGGGNLKKGLKY